jgi:hypothetical protein
MKVLVKKPDEHPTIEEIPNELESLQRTVGGYIETLRVIGMAGTNRTLTLICDEEAKLKTPRPKENLKLGRDVILGTVILLAAEEDYFTGLNMYEVEMGRAWLNMNAVRRKP